MSVPKGHEHTPACHACGGHGPDAGPLALHSRCHLHAPMWPWLEGAKLTLKCAECERVVASFTIAVEATH